MVHLDRYLGEITYEARKRCRKPCFGYPKKQHRPFSEFLREVSRQASLFQGDCFSKIFRETAQQCLKDSALHKKDLEAFSQLGEYLGWMDITLQKNTITLYQEQLKQEIQYLERELPGRKKMCRALE